MSRCDPVDIWDAERDPAVRRLRDALQPPTPAPDPPRTAVTPEVVPQDPPGEMAAPVESGRRERILALVERVRAGDVPAIKALRDLIDR